MNESHTLDGAAGANTSNHAAKPRELAIEDNLFKIQRHLRLDGIFFFIVSLSTLILMWRDINLYHFVGLFFIIDIVGYYPSVIFSAIWKERKVPKPFYWLYNFFHSNSGGICIAVIYIGFGGSIVNAIAIPLHYGIDRGFLGNYIKSYGTKI